jgi:hypothetical protein
LIAGAGSSDGIVHGQPVQGRMWNKISIKKHRYCTLIALLGPGRERRGKGRRGRGRERGERTQ